MKKVLAIAFLLAVSVHAEYDDYRSAPAGRPQTYSTDRGMDRNIGVMNARLSFLQTPRFTPPPTKFDTWKNEPLVQTAPVRKPDSFLAFVGRSIKQNVVEFGKAIVAAVVKPFQAVKEMVTGLVRTFKPLVTPAPPTPRQPGFTPTPQTKPLINTTPIQTQKPVHNITLVGQPETGKPKNVFIGIEQKATVTMKGQDVVRDVMNGIRTVFGRPIMVPVNKIYPEPGNDITIRRGYDYDAIGRRKQQIAAGERPVIYAVKTPLGWAATNRQHAHEAYRQMGYKYVPVVRVKK